MKTVHIESKGPTGMGTTITNENGERVHGVRQARIALRHDAATVAELELLCATVSIVAIPQFFVEDPATGELKQVKTIEFLDGTTFVQGEGV